MITEMSQRLGRIHDLLAELENIRRLYSTRGVQLSFNTSTSPSVTFTFEGESKNKKRVVLELKGINYLYPFSSGLSFELREVKLGNRTAEESMGLLLDRLLLNRSYGFFLKLCTNMLTQIR